MKADPDLGAPSAWGGEIAFILQLGFVAFSGLVLYVLGQTMAMPLLLLIHLGAVLSFFCLCHSPRWFTVFTALRLWYGMHKERGAS